MAGDLELAAEITSRFRREGVDDAKASLAGLTASANSAAVGTGGLADSTEKLAVKQEVSKREIKILTAEILRSVGITQEAAAAGRVAAEGYSAMGNSAHIANLALAATGLAVVAIIPLIMSWVGASKEAAEANERLKDALIGQLGRLDNYLDKVHNAPADIRAWAAALRDLALEKQGKEIDDNKKKITELSAAIKDDTEVLERNVSRILRGGEVVHIDAEGRKKLTDRIKENRTELNALTRTTQQMEDAQKKRITTDEKLTKLDKEGADAEKKAKDAEEARLHLAAMFEQASGKRIAAQQRELIATSGWSKEQVMDLFKVRTTTQREASDIAKHMETLENRIEFLTKRRGVNLDKEVDALRKWKKNNADILDGTRLVTNDEIDKMIDDFVKLEEAVEKAQQVHQQNIAEAAAQGLGAMSQLFGKNKEIAIAGAIADTYAAANKAFYAAGGYPWGIAPMVATILQGLANVQNIRKSGFDDPINDFLARRLGRKFASDALENIMTGWQGGLHEASKTSQHTTINRGTTINKLLVQGFVGMNKTQFFRQLTRELIISQRLEDRNAVGRKP